MFKIFLAVFAAATLSAQKPLSKQEEILIRLDKLEAQNTEILKILKEADAPPAPPAPLKIDVSKSNFLGLADAPITIVEFTDFQCPFCSQFHTKTFPVIHDKYIVTGEVKFVSRDLPLPFHANAHQAAEAVRCAGEQKHFWEMRDWAQSNPERLELLQLFEHAKEFDNLDAEQYRVCMAEGRYKDAIDRDAKIAQDLDIQGTPAFIVGISRSDQVIEGELIKGAMPLAAFEKAIENQKNKLAK